MGKLGGRSPFNALVGVLLAMGVAYSRKGSWPSLIGGVGCGAALLSTNALAPRRGFKLGALVSFLLTAGMIPCVVKSGTFMPAGLVSALGVLSLLYNTRQFREAERLEVRRRKAQQEFPGILQSNDPDWILYKWNILKGSGLVTDETKLQELQQKLDTRVGRLKAEQEAAERKAKEAADAHRKRELEEAASVTRVAIRGTCWNTPTTMELYQIGSCEVRGTGSNVNGKFTAKGTGTLEQSMDLIITNQYGDVKFHLSSDGKGGYSGRYQQLDGGWHDDVEMKAEKRAEAKRAEERSKKPFSPTSTQALAGSHGFWYYPPDEGRAERGDFQAALNEGKAEVVQQIIVRHAESLGLEVARKGGDRRIRRYAAELVHGARRLRLGLSYDAPPPPYDQDPRASGARQLLGRLCEERARGQRSWRALVAQRGGVQLAAVALQELGALQ